MILSFHPHCHWVSQAPVNTSCLDFRQWLFTAHSAFMLFPAGPFSLLRSDQPVENTSFMKWLSYPGLQGVPVARRNEAPCSIFTWMFCCSPTGLFSPLHLHSRVVLLKVPSVWPGARAVFTLQGACVLHPLRGPEASAPPSDLLAHLPALLRQSVLEAVLEAGSVGSFFLVDFFLLTQSTGFRDEGGRPHSSVAGGGGWWGGGGL